jgi:hypothetical protein
MTQTEGFPTSGNDIGDRYPILCHPAACCGEVYFDNKSHYKRSDFVCQDIFLGVSRKNYGSFVKKLKGILNKRLTCHSGLSRIFLKKDSEQVGMTQTEGFPTSGNDIHSTKAGMTYKHQLSLLKLAST